MTRSATGFRQLAEKAARGAGLPPAQAQAFAKAALHHLAKERSEADLTNALSNWQDISFVRLPLSAPMGRSELAQSYAELWDAAPPPARVKPSQALLDEFGHLAAKMLVPATDASRDGAGAGAIDND